MCVKKKFFLYVNHFEIINLMEKISFFLTK